MKYTRTKSGQRCRIIKKVGDLCYCRFERTKGMPYYSWVPMDELTPTKTEVFIAFCVWCGLRRNDAINILIIGRWIVVAGIGAVLYGIIV